MIVIAIDGPAGSGKSSVSKECAKRLGFGYLDTGAAYRALTWAVMNHRISLENKDANQIAKEFDYQISLDPNNYWVRSFGTDLTEAIRSEEVAGNVSSVAAMSEVRIFMMSLTRDLVSKSGLPGVIVEGRDITTVVFPDANIRILLTASEEVRILRRSQELPSAATSELVSKRDQEDSKVVDFMTPSEGVILIDTSDLSFEASVAAVIDAVEGVI